MSASNSANGNVGGGAGAGGSSLGGGGGGYGGGNGGGGGGGSNGGNGGGGYVGAAGTNQGAWNGNGPSLGLTTGNTIYGNTAFGPAGGMATGYATRDAQSLAAAGMAPTLGQYGQFRNLNGGAMFPGLNNPMQSAQGYTAGQVAQHLAMLQAAARAHAMGQAGGLLGPAHINVQPVENPIYPHPAPYPPTPYWNGNMWNHMPTNFMHNPTQRPYDPAYSPGPGATYYQNGSTAYKNNMGGIGIGGSSTQYQNNMGTGLGGGSTQYMGP